MIVWCVTYLGNDERMTQRNKGKTWRKSDDVAEEKSRQRAPLVIVLKWAWAESKRLGLAECEFDIEEAVNLL